MVEGKSLTYCDVKHASCVCEGGGRVVAGEWRRWQWWVTGGQGGKRQEAELLRGEPMRAGAHTSAVCCL